MPSPTDTDALHHVTLVDGRRAVVKHRRDAPEGFFQAEARGLEALREANALRVPVVHEVSAQRIVLEDLGQGVPAADYWQRAGAGLAAQHRQTAERFGFVHDGFCGDSPQTNGVDDDGWRFFAEQRLLPQMRRAGDTGLIERCDTHAIEAICTRLPQNVPAMPPVLLHGDLWRGNLHVCADAAPALIDAGAVHYGWAEAELAMLVLFGGPPEAFFHAYAGHAPLRHDWRQRAPIYNIYHLLNHVNLFGTGYLQPLRGALAACTNPDRY